MSRRSWWTRFTEHLEALAGFFRREWQRVLDAATREEWNEIAAERPPVSMPERPTAAGYPDHLLPDAGERELRSTAREMEEDEDWYSALELYLELIRRAEKAADGTLDVTLYNRIGDLHRRLAAEWYLEGVDRYAERQLGRGAIALSEKALHLFPEHPHARRRRDWLARTVERRENPPATASPPAEPPSPAPDAGRPEIGDEEPEPEAPVSEAVRPSEEVPDQRAREPLAVRLGEVYVPGPNSDAKSDRSSEGDASTGGDAPLVALSKRATTSLEEEEAPAEEPPEERFDDSGDLDEERLPERILVPPPDSAFEGRRLRVRWRIAVGVALVAAAVAIVMAT